MHIFSCPCLNIQVHARGAIPFLQNVTYPHFVKMIGTDSFFSPGAFAITLDLGGVSKSQKSLCKEREVDGWIITTCTCCGLEMYAQYPEDHDRVIVSPMAEQNPETISQLRQSHRYSRVFKLVLPEINDNFIQNNIGIELRNSNLDSSIEQVQTLVSNYLREEQKEMEERIRKYTEAQQAAYADLLQKVRKHKQAMVYLLLKSKENEVSNHKETTVNGSPASSPTAPVTKDTGGSNESSTSTDSAYDRSDASELSNGRPKKQNNRILRRTMSNPVRTSKPKKGPRRPPVHIDVGGVFDMEEFDSKEEFSDIDSEESEGSIIDDIVHEKEVERMMCATSLPMSIPTFSLHPRASVYEDDDEDLDPLPKDPEQIAASMRALACSVKDGTEMFGELPRRRLNTGELLSARPL